MPFQKLDKVLIMVSNRPWNGEPSDTSEVIKHINSICAVMPNFELVQGNWATEKDQRNAGLAKLYKEGIDYTFIVDGDEIYHEQHVRGIQQYVQANPAVAAFHIEWNTFWTKKYYVIAPREQFKPVVVVKTSGFVFTGLRQGTTNITRAGDMVFVSAPEMGKAQPYNYQVIPTQVAFCYHLSYARTDGVIKRKIETFSHAPEIVDGWYENVWKKWTPESTNLHPVTPMQYKRAVKYRFVDFPAQLQSFIKYERRSIPCSIVILNWNSCDLLRRCLSQIEYNTSGVGYEVIIVDNGSVKDDSVSYLQALTEKSFAFPFKVVYNKENLGFAGGVNSGLAVANPDSDVCLLNVDAEVQVGWLEELYNSMIRVPQSGLIGPLGNKVDSGYQAEGTVKEDTVVPNLHFYCTLIFRPLIDQIGKFDTRFGLGGWEDNDYGTRAKLAGFCHVISAKSLVRHEAHQVYKLNGEDSTALDRINERKFLDKYYAVLFEVAQAFDPYGISDLAKKAGLFLE
jgi:glycosyltransferase involved in cell wall biosynthesis